MENHHSQWVNPLFLWPFSIAMLNYQRVSMLYARLPLYAQHRGIRPERSNEWRRLGVGWCLKTSCGRRFEGFLSHGGNPKLMIYEFLMENPVNDLGVPPSWWNYDSVSWNSAGYMSIPFIMTFIWGKDRAKGLLLNRSLNIYPPRLSVCNETK